ncbi:hypothetical protein HDU93_000764 [Gonapodya sp. JEL0774]|nr:hypothetical protein HDU93_000764 [Gonapodya sp. JEL0774]
MLLHSSKSQHLLVTRTQSSVSLSTTGCYFAPKEIGTGRPRFRHTLHTSLHDRCSVAAVNSWNDGMRQNLLNQSTRAPTTTATRRRHLAIQSEKAQIRLFSNTSDSGSFEGRDGRSSSLMLNQLYVPPPVSDLTDPSQSFDLLPYDYLDRAAIDKLVLLAHAYLSLPHPLNVKHVILAHPHPGGVYLLEDMAKALAQRMGAGFLSLDYADLLDIAQEGSPPDQSSTGGVRTESGSHRSARAVKQHREDGELVLKAFPEVWGAIQHPWAFPEEASHYHFTPPFLVSSLLPASRTIHDASGSHSASSVDDAHGDPANSQAVSGRSDGEEDEFDGENDEVEGEDEDGDGNDRYPPNGGSQSRMDGNGMGPSAFTFPSGATIGPITMHNYFVDTGTRRSGRRKSSGGWLDILQAARGQSGSQGPFLPATFGQFHVANDVPSQFSAGEPRIANNLYSTPIPAQSPSFLRSSLVSFIESLPSAIPLILHLRDMSDLVSPQGLETASQSGWDDQPPGGRLLAALLLALGDARSRGRRVLLVGGSAAPVTDQRQPTSDESDAYASSIAALNTAEAWRRLLRGEHRRFSDPTAPYATPFDDPSLSHTLTKVCVAPPAPPISSKTAPLERQSGIVKPSLTLDLSEHARFESWLQTSEDAWSKRIGEVNSGSIVRWCAKALGRDVEGNSMRSRRVLEDAMEDDAFKAELEMEVWDVNRVEAMGEAAIGAAMERSGLDANGLLGLTKDDFVRAFHTLMKSQPGHREKEERERIAHLERQRVLSEQKLDREIAMEQERLRNRRSDVGESSGRTDSVNEARDDHGRPGRGDGGMSVVADTVDRGEDTDGAREHSQPQRGHQAHHSVDPTATSQVASAPGPLGSSSTHQKSTSSLLSSRGYKLNQYEKKLLPCVIEPRAMTTSFKDLVLPPTTKLALQDVTTLPLLRPDLFSHGILRKANFSGVLLFGPPGTGKTMLAKCVAQAGSARFMNVALSDVFDKYVGEGEKNVKALFTLARKLAPCVVFLDEVDALFGRRRGDGFASRREVINEFMGEWEGLQSHENKGIVVMAATNRPFDLDEAVLRRMPRRILVDLPTEVARAKILGTHLGDEILDASVSLDDIARRTPLYSGSDLRNMCIAAALASVKENVVRGRMGLPMLVDKVDIGADLREEVLKSIGNIEDWAGYVAEADGAHGTAATLDNEVGGPDRVLTKEHFEIALKEIPASITDETDMLVELRKWDKQFGSGSAVREKGKRVWGFVDTKDELGVDITIRK